MVIGENGFYYPQVDTMKCVECGLCSKNCHVLNKPETQNFEKLYYCGWETSETKRVEGSSGGVFGAIAEKILSNKGIVYGAALSSDKKRLFHCSTKDVSLEDLKKSKYLESDMGNTTSFIRKDIKEGKTVLFCGTPCQVYGVRKIFGYKYENLVLCDFLCHGVPSQVRYQQYLKELETKYDSPIKNVGFRTKRFGWKTYCIVIDFENGKQYVKLANEDPYYKQFFSNINLQFRAIILCIPFSKASQPLSQTCAWFKSKVLFQGGCISISYRYITWLHWYKFFVSFKVIIFR